MKFADSGLFQKKTTKANICALGTGLELFEYGDGTTDILRAAPRRVGTCFAHKKLVL